MTGVKYNASAITYSPISNTLFMVVNNPEMIYELNLAGKLIRTIELAGFKDTEGLAHIDGNRFALPEERRATINFVTISDTTRRLEKISSGALCTEHFC